MLVVGRLTRNAASTATSWPPTEKEYRMALKIVLQANFSSHVSDGHASGPAPRQQQHALDA